MTPTVLRKEGFQFFFYSREGTEPPHIHVSKGGATAKVWLEKLELADIYGFNPNERRRILAIIRAHQIELLEQWHDYFDQGPSGHTS